MKRASDLLGLPVLDADGRGIGQAHDVRLARDAPVQGTFRQMNRTSVNLGIGHEWYLMGNACSCACGRDQKGAVFAEPVQGSVGPVPLGLFLGFFLVPSRVVGDYVDPPDAIYL